MATVVGNPEPSLTWFHNEKQIDKKSGIALEKADNDCHLTIKDTTEEMAGTYKVEAVNTIGRASSQASLNVLGKMRMGLTFSG